MSSSYSWDVEYEKCYREELTMTSMIPPACSQCGQDRPNGMPHDSQRCATIARACRIVHTSRGFGYSKTIGQIAELAWWLHDHAGQSQTRQSKIAELDRLVESRGDRP